MEFFTPFGSGQAVHNYGNEKREEFALRNVVHVFGAVNAIADQAARLPIRVREGGRWTPEDGNFINDHAISNMLNNKPSPYEISYVWRHRLSAQLLLSKKGAFIEIIRDRLDRPVALALLPASYTAPIPDATTFVSGYEVKPPNAPQGRFLPPEDVIWVRVPHPFNPYGAMTPVEAAGLAIDTDYLAALYDRNFLSNDGRPGLIVAMKGRVSEETKRDIKGRFSGGPNRAGEPVILGTDEVSVVDTSATPRDAQYVQSRNLARDEILTAFGVPRTVMGQAEGKTFANADAEVEVFWENRMSSHLAVLEHAYDALLDEGEDAHVIHDISDVAVLQRRKNERQTFLLTEVEKGVRTKDEYRATLGLDPLPEDPAVAAAAEAYADNPGAAGDPNATRLNAPRPPQGPDTVEPGTKVAAYSGTPGSADLEAIARDHERFLDEHERMVRGEVRSFFRRQENAVLSRLRGEQARKGTRHWLGAGSGTKSISVGGVFDRERWDDDLATEMESVLGDVVTASLNRTRDRINQAAGFDVNGETPYELGDDEVEEILRKRVPQLAGEVNKTTLAKISAALAAGEEAGEGIDDIAKRVRAVFRDASAGRAHTIARTEVGIATQMAAEAEAARSGVVSSKRWLATSDARTRPDHADADGQTVPFSGRFEVGGAELWFPSDPLGPADQIINCRCVALFLVDEEKVLRHLETKRVRGQTAAERSFVRDELGRFSSNPWKALSKNAAEKTLKKYVETRPGVTPESPAEYRALQEYKGDRYRDLQARARVKGVGSGSQEDRDRMAELDGAEIAKLDEIITNMDRMVERARWPFPPMAVFRGVVSKELADKVKAGELAPGTVIDDPGFASTTAVEQVADTFTEGSKNGVTMVVRLETGDAALPVDQQGEEFDSLEYELVLPRNTRFVVVESGVKEGLTYIETEMVSDAARLAWQERTTKTEVTNA